MSDDIKVLGIFGSLCSGFYNSVVLQEVIGLVLLGMSIELVDIFGILLYNEDVYVFGFLFVVECFCEQICVVDVLLFVILEYNYLMVGVLKNVIDWVLWLLEQLFFGKLVVIFGVSVGCFGIVWVQYYLCQMLVFFDVYLLNKLEVMIFSVQNVFDVQGWLFDDKVCELIQQQLQVLQLWVCCLCG